MFRISDYYARGASGLESDNKNKEKRSGGFFRNFKKKSLKQRYLTYFLAAVCAIAIVTVVLAILSHNELIFFTKNHKMNWYGYIIAVAIILCLFPGIYASLKQGYYADLVFEYIIFAVPFAFLGAALYYAVTVGNFGGLGVLGGIIGAFVGILVGMVFWQVILKHPKVKFIQMLDLAGPFILLGQAVGRFGCYFGHCCYGIKVDWDFFPFSYSYDGGVTFHLGNPFIESIWCFIGFIIFAGMYMSRRKSFNGFYISLYCIWYGFERLILEGFRDPSQKLLLTGGYGEGFGVSQFTSLLMILFGVAWIAQYVIRALVAKKIPMIHIPKEKLSDRYFEYEKTIFAHPQVDEEGRPIEAETAEESAGKGDGEDGK